MKKSDKIVIWFAIVCLILQIFAMIFLGQKSSALANNVVSPCTKTQLMSTSIWNAYHTNFGWDNKPFVFAKADNSGGSSYYYNQYILAFGTDTSVSDAGTGISELHYHWGILINPSTCQSTDWFGDNNYWNTDSVMGLQGSARYFTEYYLGGNLSARETKTPLFDYNLTQNQSLVTYKGNLAFAKDDLHVFDYYLIKSNSSYDYEITENVIDHQQLGSQKPYIYNGKLDSGYYVIFIGYTTKIPGLPLEYDVAPVSINFSLMSQNTVLTGSSENCEGNICNAIDTSDFSSLISQCVSETFPFLDIDACSRPIQSIARTLSFNKIQFANDWSGSSDCRNLVVLDEWLNLPSNYQVCPAFSSSVRDTITPFLTLLLGLLTIRFLGTRDQVR